MPELEGLTGWENAHAEDADKTENANMDTLDFEMLPEEVEHR